MIKIQPSGTTEDISTDLDVGDDCLLVHGDGEDLAPPVDADDAIAGVVLRRHEDGVRTDAVLVDEGASLDVVEVHVAVLGDQVHDVVLAGHLTWKTDLNTSPSYRQVQCTQLEESWLVASGKWQWRAGQARRVRECPGRARVVQTGQWPPGHHSVSCKLFRWLPAPARYSGTLAATASHFSWRKNKILDSTRPAHRKVGHLKLDTHKVEEVQTQI